MHICKLFFMKKNNIIVVFSSHLSEEENEHFKQHISDTIGIKYFKTICYPNFNEYSLTELYNKALAEHIESNSIFVFCHNDIIFRTRNWGVLLLHRFNITNYDIIGVAGTTFMSDNGVWWTDRTKMVGIVEHTDGTNTWVSEYSKHRNGEITPTVLIDGVFMAVNPETIQVGFNEDFKGFHHYDTSFCLENYLEGCNIGVTTDIRILHKSVGMVNDEWEKNRQQLVELYKGELPLKYLSPYGNLKILFAIRSFKNLTGSELVIYEYAKELAKRGNDVTIIALMIGDPLVKKAKKYGIKVYSLKEAPNFRLEGRTGKFVRNDVDFDIIHLNHKDISKHIIKMYLNTPAVMHIHSEIIPKIEEPIIDPMIKKYISIREGVTQHIKSFGVDEKDIILLNNPYDTKRFNTNYKQQKNEKEIVLFVGTIDSLRIKVLDDLAQTTEKNNQLLWIVGADNFNNIHLFKKYKHVTYFGVKHNVEDYYKKCDYTAGILVGRSTIEGFLCGKRGWVYDVDNRGNILNKTLMDVPDNLERFSVENTTNKLFNIYETVIEETWQ